MTTIAWDGRYIAIDSRITSHNTFIVTDDRHKFYENSEWVIFWCGADSEIDGYIDAFLNDKPVDEKVNIGLYAYEKKTKNVFQVSDTDGKIWKGVLRESMACGSGADFAISAIDHGKSAVDAVRYAITRDACSGGKIHCFDTLTGKFVKVSQ